MHVNEQVILVSGIDLVWDHVINRDPLNLIVLNRDHRLVDSSLYLCHLCLSIRRDERQPLCVVLRDIPQLLQAL